MAILIYDLLVKPEVATPHVIGRGLLPKKGQMVIAGSPKSNKSWIALNLAIALANGSPPFLAKYKSDTQVFPIYGENKVLYFDMEMSEEGIKDRCRAGLLSEEAAFGLKLAFCPRDFRFRVDTSEGRKLIEEEIAAEKPSVVIFDPLAQVNGGDENDSRAMGDVMRFGGFLCDTYSTSNIFIHHTAKPGFDPSNQRHGGDRLRGSSALYGAVDTVVLVDRISTEEVPQPAIRLSFELRRGKPLLRQYIQRLQTGQVLYLGEGREGDKIVQQLKDVNG